MMEEMRILSTTAILGYGFPMESFEEGMKRKPHVIAVDAGSTDPGPYYLGAGISFTDRNSVERDLEIMIPAGLEAKVPVVVGTAGGSGARPHVEFVLDIVREIAREKGLSFKMAVIQSEFEKDFIKENVRRGNVSPLHPAPEITEADVDESVHIVAQMGEEPFIEALTQGADVVIAGRSYDPAVFSSLAIKDSFVLEPLSPLRKCTTLSVAAHTLYEKTNPYVLPGPGGAINLHESKFEQISDNMVRVSGSKFVPTEDYFVTLEGVRKVGYRTISCAGVKDPVMILKIDDVTRSVRERVVNNFETYGIRDFFLDFKIYGKNGVMAMFDGLDESHSDELLIIIEAVAATQEQANTICGFARSTMLHFGYEGRISTAGNLAFPFSPSDCKMGEVYEFNIYHLMKVDDPKALFPITYEVFNKGQKQ